MHNCSWFTAAHVVTVGEGVAKLDSSSDNGLRGTDWILNFTPLTETDGCGAGLGHDLVRFFFYYYEEGTGTQ